jgi:NADPH:quinone reductase-like Zn-dependent oxidoreductase
MEVKMIHELRVFPCVPGRLPTLLRRFEKDTLRLFEGGGGADIVIDSIAGDVLGVALGVLAPNGSLTTSVESSSLGSGLSRSEIRATIFS